MTALDVESVEDLMETLVTVQSFGLNTDAWDDEGFDKNVDVRKISAEYKLMSEEDQHDVILNTDDGEVTFPFDTSAANLMPGGVGVRPKGTLFDLRFRPVVLDFDSDDIEDDLDEIRNVVGLVDSLFIVTSANIVESIAPRFKLEWLCSAVTSIFPRATILLVHTDDTLDSLRTKYDSSERLTVISPESDYLRLYGDK